MTIWKRACTSSASCVEIGYDGDRIHVRDSKNPSGAILSFTETEWDVFIAGVKAGVFDWTTDTEEQQ